jgi:hypothetical protein
MAKFDPTDFSYYNVLRLSARFPDMDAATEALLFGYANSFEESVTTTTITKRYEGVVRKTRALGTGSGTISMSLHMQYDVFAKSFGMVFPDLLKPGVQGYGSESRHVPFVLTCLVENEDGKRLLRAYPQAIAQEGFSRNSEDNTEEVSALDIVYAFMPDENGFGLYEAFVDDLFPDGTDEDKAAYVEQWLLNWDSSLVLLEAAADPEA